MTSLRDLGWLPLIMSAVTGLAGVAAARGDDARAGRLVGVAQSLEDQVGTLPTPPDAGAHEPHLAGRPQQGRGPLGTYRTEGRQMAPEAALDYAMS